jgi:2-polyprenyl-3-methyl-5-hydroxy-6-metoxy-1,4-benzoquinol methylase
LDKRARVLLSAVLKTRVDGCSVLDVGAGIGALGLELLKHGAARVTLADASPAYLDAAAQQAEEMHLRDCVEVAPGDFVDIAAGLERADIVVLDRVICCYPDWSGLLDAAASRCRGVLGISYPRGRADIRLLIAFENIRRRFMRDAFRAYVHPSRLMKQALRDTGFTWIGYTATYFWVIELYARGSTAARAAPIAPAHHQRERDRSRARQ